MKIFISWSGEISKLVAEQLKSWLPSVIQTVAPFASSRDIQTGGRWFAEIGNELQQTNFGILCITPDNMNAPWMLFEAGALQKNVPNSKVAPLLIGLPKEQLPQPLALFQMCTTSREEVFHLLETINNEVPSGKLTTEILKNTFDLWWPQLNAVLQDAEAKVRQAAAARPRPQPTMSDVLKTLQETREITEGISRSIANLQSPPYIPSFMANPLNGPQLVSNPLLGGAKGAFYAPPQNMGGNLVWMGNNPAFTGQLNQNPFLTDKDGSILFDQAGNPILISESSLQRAVQGPSAPKTPAAEAPTTREKPAGDENKDKK